MINTRFIAQQPINSPLQFPKSPPEMSSCTSLSYLSNKKVLVVLTSVNTLRSNSKPDEKRPTGCNIKELAYLHERLFKPHPQIQWTLCTPAGSEAPLDPTSERERERDSVVEQFMRDENIRHKLQNTPKLSSINASKYSAVFFMGGPGAMLDFPEHEESISEIVCNVYYKNNGIVASIGHGLAAIVGLEKPEGEQRRRPSSNNNSDSSNSFIANRTVTGMTEEEEKDLGLENFVPFSLEERCKENGGKFEKKPKFTSNAITDERLVTAQNQESSAEWINQISEVCRKMHRHEEQKERP